MQRDEQSFTQVPSKIKEKLQALETPSLNDYWYPNKNVALLENSPIPLNHAFLTPNFSINNKGKYLPEDLIYVDLILQKYNF